MVQSRSSVTVTPLPPYINADRFWSGRHVTYDVTHLRQYQALSLPDWSHEEGQQARKESQKRTQSFSMNCKSDPMERNHLSQVSDHIFREIIRPETGIAASK